MKRVWIYQAARFLTSDEKARVQEELDAFVAAWTAHGTKLAGTAEILYDLFIVLQVDESVANATGCSIDKSVHLLKDLEQTLGISLFDRLSVAYRNNQGEIAIANRSDFQQLVRDGIVDANTVVFNNMIVSGDDFPDRWEIPFTESWHARVFIR